ncbi:MAG: O-antigen ligase family protein [Candidatus Omnitrophota bacterium]|nr:MAG: O-antigen ligase family protein [Candidatus Omnitrophota bacterium]
MRKDKIIDILNKTIEWSLYILVFSIPFSKTAIEACILVASIAWISKKVLTKDFSLKKTPINTALFAFFIISAISIINADFKMMAMRALVSKCLKYIFLYFIVIESVDSERKFKNLLKVAFVSAVIVMIDSYLQYYVLHKDIFRSRVPFKYRQNFKGDSLVLGFPTGPFPFPNDLSAWMLIILLPALSLFIWQVTKRSTKFILGLFLAPFLFLFYLANTRAAWFGFVISFFALIFVRKRKLLTLFLVMFLVALLIMFFFLPGERMGSIFGFLSWWDRVYMWRISWNVFMEHPIIGNGINMFYGKFKEFREDKYTGLLGSYAHNGFLQIAADIGIMGLAIFLLIIGKVLKRGFTSRANPLALGMAAGLSAFLIHSFFDTNLQSLPLASFFWLSMALLMSL